jgi:hypothetical protein
MSVCGMNDPRNTCDEYSVLLTKSGMRMHHFPSKIDGTRHRTMMAPESRAMI